MSEYQAPGLYYRHSGHFTAAAVIQSLLGGGLAAIVLAFVYAYATLYCPFIYINFILTALYGGAVGAIAALILKSRHARNTPVATLAGLVVGLVALYADWAAWIFALLGRADMDRNLLALATNPSFLWSYIVQVSEVGYWKIGGDKPTGLVLWLVWGVEAAVILGVAAFSAAGVMGEEPYCEPCGAWCKAKPRVAEFQPCDPADLKRQMEAKDLKLLEGLGSPAAEADSWLEAKLHQCGTCESTNTLTLEMVTAKKDKANRSKARNQKSTSKKTVIDKLLVTAVEAGAIKKIGEKRAAPATPAA